MIYSRSIGDARVHNVIEYIGPTHSAEFVFPQLDLRELQKHLHWLAPHHYVPHMQRFVIAMQIWVVHAGGNVIVIDCGVGNHKRRAAERMNMLNGLTPLWLAAAGATAESVTHVVTTHFHSDHVGWNTHLVDGRWEPMFPNARYLVPKIDFDAALADYERGQPNVMFGSFEDSVFPVYKAGLIDFVDGAKEVAGCLAVELMPGHTMGSLHYRLRSGGEEGVFGGDVMHSALQIAMPHLNSWIDCHADHARASRALFLKRAAERNSLIMPAHFGWPHCGFVRGDSEHGYHFEPAEPGPRDT